MHREDAIAAGHIAPLRQAQDAAQGGEKMRAAGENKMLPAAEDKFHEPAGDKAPPTPQRGEEEEADFTSIPGVGPATARALKAQRIQTFEQLRAAGQLDFISPQAREAIEQWKKSGDDTG
jgi:predicted flap endonuclease-1-like 5' DNA nuclease